LSSATVPSKSITFILGGLRLNARDLTKTNFKLARLAANRGLEFLKSIPESEEIG
jgi:hypothetical protein